MKDAGILAVIAVTLVVCGILASPAQAASTPTEDVDSFGFAGPFGNGPGEDPGGTNSNTMPEDTPAPGPANDGNTAGLSLLIQDVTPDSGGGQPARTDLTLNDITITGPDAEDYEIIAFTDGTLVHKGDGLSLEIRFTASAPLGEKTAVLTIMTDEGTLLGGDGMDFQYTLVARNVPDPATVFIVMAAGLPALLKRRRSRG